MAAYILADSLKEKRKSEEQKIRRSEEPSQFLTFMPSHLLSVLSGLDFPIADSLKD
jgi:hypothetical protein